MPRHRYRAARADGRLQRGKMDALNLAELEARLARIGLVLINGEPVRARRLPGRRIPRRDLVSLCFHLEHLLAAGVPILEGLADLHASTAEPRLREIVGTVAAGVEGGQTLSAACAAHPEAFDAVFICLLRAGEQAGRLPQVLRDLAASLEQADALAAYTRRIAIYPAFVGTILLAAVGVALVFVIPEVARLFQSIGQTLPLQTRMLLALSAFVGEYGALLVFAALATVIGLRAAIAHAPSARARYDAALLRLPVCGPLLSKLLLARVCKLLGLMYEAGIPIVDALHTAADTAGNTVVRRGLREAGERIDSGHDLSSAIAAAALFPPLLVRMLHVGEHSGALDVALGHLVRYYEREVQDSIQRMQAAIEPLLTVVLGGLMLWIMSAVLGPIYDILGRLPL